jgi:hypothetical protein
MSHRSVMAASVLLVVFGCLMVATQISGCNSQRLGKASVADSFIEGEYFAKISNIVDRVNIMNTDAGFGRGLDLILPGNARVFMAGVTGNTNGSSLGHYYFVTYYLFPREVAVSLDEPRFTMNGIQGRSTDSDAEMLANGFDVCVNLKPEGNVLFASALRPLTLKEPANPDWFDYWPDTVTAFMLPLLTALSGVWLLRFLFSPGLSRRIPLAEQLACGLGLGMMAVAALTLGVKLCGFHGRGWVLALAGVGSAAELWRDRNVFGIAITGGFRRMVSKPVAGVLAAVAVVVFLVLFRLAALQGIVEFDATADWLFKAKIFFLCTGHEIVGWFSNPRLAYAHMDYPTLVPSLHTATYDSIGHVDEFVTKFWPTWMLLFLLMALASLSRGKTSRFHAPLFFLLGVLLLPFTQNYVHMEGGTMPTIFFTVSGFVQCAIGAVEKDRARLGLGLTLLFGAAMSKFEGMIFLALAAGWILMLPKVRPSLGLSPRLWRMLAFCFLAALPFICLRVQIPALHPESGWVGYALAHPGITLSGAPKIFLIMLARLFVSPGFASWGAVDGQLHWTGQWDGLSSLFNHLTLGLAWVGLLMTIVLWVASPSRRPIILWTLAVFVSAAAVFSVVFASFVSVSGLNDVISVRTADNETGRYLFPILLAWISAMVILFFGDFPPPATSPNGRTVSANPSSRAESGLETTKACGYFQ